MFIHSVEIIFASVIQIYYLCMTDTLWLLSCWTCIWMQQMQSDIT